jgi:ferric-dicitrate binding protein FerR (iron transport regulator)
MAVVMNEAKELLSVISPGLSAGEVEAELEKFKELFIAQPVNTTDFAEEALISDHLAIEPQRKLRTNRTRRNWYIGITAASLLIAAWLFWPRPADKPVTLAVVEHATGFGERLEVLLPDGSTVILNSNSRLRYKSDFNQQERRLELSGEAYFDVAANPSKKFTVSTDRFTTSAFGTAFYFLGREPSQLYSVNLLEGKLNVENKSGGSLMLAPGEQAAWPGGQSAFNKNRFDSTQLRQWINGRLQFERAAMKEVLPQLAEWYAVEIEDLRSRPGTISITGDYSNKPLEDILKAICFSLSCRYTIYGNKIIIQ